MFGSKRWQYGHLQGRPDRELLESQILQLVPVVVLVSLVSDARYVFE